MHVSYNDRTDLLYIRLDDKKQDMINRRVSDDVVLDIGEGEGRKNGINTSLFLGSGAEFFPVWPKGHREVHMDQAEFPGRLIRRSSGAGHIQILLCQTGKIDGGRRGPPFPSNCGH